MLTQRIEEWLRDEEVFERERTTNEIRALGIALYHGGLSCWKAGEALGVSHQAVLDWFGAAAWFFHGLKPAPRKRIAVDEKAFHLPGGDAYLWAAVDLDTDGCIAVYASTTRSCFDAYAFMRKVKAVCTGRLPRVFVDGGSWYPWAFQRLGFDRHHVVHWGPRSAIERYFSLVDHRAIVFWVRFPHRSSVQSLLKWGEAFAGVHNLRRGLT